MATEAPILAYFDRKKEVVIQCDASNEGLGAVLLQDGKPIAFKSKTLTTTQENYAAIEKEMLAVTWSLEKFHQYTYGRPVMIHSDHKPLETISNKPLAKAPRRLQNMLLKAQDYDYCIVYKPGQQQVIADMLSRAAIPNSGYRAYYEQIHVTKYLPIGEERLQKIKYETVKDEVLKMLAETIATGWPSDRSMLHPVLYPYHSYSDELSMHDGILYKNHRIIIPTNLRKEMKEAVHRNSHIGEGCFRRMRECLFWPGMNAEVREYIATCDICRQHEIGQQKEPMMHVMPASRPWEKIGIDLFCLEKSNFLVSVDYFSNYIEVDNLNSDTRSQNVIKKLRALFSRYGSPLQLISDNGPQFISDEFKQFLHKWDVQHITSSPYHPRGNGKAESAVKIAKRLLRKSGTAHEDPYLALLNHRNTPVEGIGLSPSQMFLNRRCRTLLPMKAELLQSEPNLKIIEDKREKKQANMEKYYNKDAKELPPLQSDDVVRVKPYDGSRIWKKGVIKKKLNERSYEIEIDGNIYRRNRQDIRKSKEAPDSNGEVILRPLFADDHQDVEIQVTENGNIQLEDSQQDDKQIDEEGPDVREREQDTDLPLRRSTRRRERPVWMKDYVSN